MSTTPLAIFDLDGTLLRRDSFLPFLIRFGVRHRRWRALAGTPLSIGVYLLGLKSAHEAKQRLLVAFLHGVSAEAIDQAAQEFCRGWVSRQLNGPVVERLRKHQQSGDRVMLLSASPSIYVRAVADWLQIDDVVCTQVEFRKGLCTGRLEQENCKGAAKLAALKRFLQQSAAPPRSTAYGDSSHDLPVLHWVEHGFLVSGSRIDPVTPLARKATAFAPT